MGVIYGPQSNGGLFDSLFPKILGVAGTALGGPVGGLVGNFAGNLAGGQGLGNAAINTGMGAANTYGPSVFNGDNSQWNKDLDAWRNSRRQGW